MLKARYECVDVDRLERFTVYGSSSRNYVLCVMVHAQLWEIELQ